MTVVPKAHRAGRIARKDGQEMQAEDAEPIGQSEVVYSICLAEQSA